MKDLLHRLTRGEHLSADEAETAFEAIMTGTADPLQVAALLAAMQTKRPSVDEIVAAARVMRKHATPVETDLPRPILDTCGTGGDVKGTFNISTASAIVAASCGVRVVKHGNRSASSRSGSADVLEALGVNLDTTQQQREACLKHANICFAFARTHHPAMRHVAPIRLALGVPTIFNLLGPLTNPAHAEHQLLGVYSPAIGALLADALAQLGTERAWVVHGTDGLDELSTMAPSRIWDVTAGLVSESTLDPRELDIPRASLADLTVDSPQASAAKIQAVLAGDRSPAHRAARDIVRLNSAAALVVAGLADDLATALPKVDLAIDSGQSQRTLEALIASSKS